MTITNRFIALFFLFVICIQASATLNPNPETQELHINDPAIDTLIVTIVPIVTIDISSDEGSKTSCDLDDDPTENNGEFTQKIIYCDPSIYKSGLNAGDTIDIDTDVYFYDDYNLCINGKCNDFGNNKVK